MIVIVTLVVLLLFTNFLAYENDNMSNTRYSEKLALEFVAMLCIIFIFNKFTVLNLLIALSVIVIVSYVLENTLYKTFQKIVRKEGFQIRNSHTKHSNSKAYYNLNHLYPDKTRIKKEPNFNVVEPENTMEIEFEDELIIEDNNNVYIPEKINTRPNTESPRPTDTADTAGIESVTTSSVVPRQTNYETTILKQAPLSSWSNFVISMRNFFF